MQAHAALRKHDSGKSAQPYCDPIYPFQNAPGGMGQPNGFGDGPRSFWDRPGSFRGIALLSTVDTNNRILTVYNGVSYGFDARYSRKEISENGEIVRVLRSPSHHLPHKLHSSLLLFAS